MSEEILQSEIDNLLTGSGPYNDDNKPVSSTNLKNIFVWDFKSNISQDFKNKLFNKFKQLLDNFPVIFKNKTGKNITCTSFIVNEYSNLLSINNTFEQYGSDFYTRKITVGDEELIEYISPKFVNRILIDSSTDTDNFIKKTIANHFIFRPLENEIAKLTNTKLTSQDIRLKNPSHVPYTDSISQQVPTYGSHTLNLNSNNSHNLISLEFEFQDEKASGFMFLAGTKNSWLKITGIQDKTEFINTDEIKNHNLYSIFTSVNVSEESIANLKPGDTFINYNGAKFTKVPLINNSRIVATGEIVLDEDDNTGLFINSIEKDNKADYFENCVDNLFVIAGSTYFDQQQIDKLETKQNVMFNTTITGLFPVMYNNKIIAQADVINYYSYPLIRIVKVEQNPIDFAK